MATGSRKAKPSTLWSEFATPILMLVSFVLGAGGTWVIMRSTAPDHPPAVPRFTSAPPSPAATEPPDVSQLTPAEAARTLADWNYDRQNWPHAIEHYQEAIARGADNPDVRTDLGNCFRFLGQAQKALEQYELAQKENPQHENSLFNQAGLYAEMLHDDQRALTIAQEFISRFPQSPKAQSAKELISRIRGETRKE